MNDEGLRREDASPAPRAVGVLAEGIGRLLGIEPDERAPRRLAGAIVDAIPEADFAAVAIAADGAVDLAAAIGLDEGAEPLAGPLAQEAIAAGATRVALAPGPPFPPGTRVGVAAAGAAGGTSCALLVGSRSAEALSDDALLLARVAADRAALALERARLERERTHQAELHRGSAEELESRRRAVDYVLGIVGHDLRNPLGAIHMSTALLQKRGGLAGWQAQTVERMRSSAGRMARIIADLLSYTRTRLGNGLPIARRPARLDELVTKVVDELRAANAAREIAITAEGDLSGEWDPDRIEQVASNLVSNAVDHGDPGAAVRVELVGEPEHVVLRVRNDGPSLPPEVLSHLFEPFSRGPDEKSRKASGLGLGLYISREIVRGHGGEIGAVSNDQTVVTVRLPRRPAGPPGT